MITDGFFVLGLGRAAKKAAVYVNPSVVASTPHN